MVRNNLKRIEGFYHGVHTSVGAASSLKVPLTMVNIGS
jgi:hypothetical protein